MFGQTTGKVQPALSQCRILQAEGRSNCVKTRCLTCPVRLVLSLDSHRISARNFVKSPLESSSEQILLHQPSHRRSPLSRANEDNPAVAPRVEAGTKNKHEHQKPSAKLRKCTILLAVLLCMIICASILAVVFGLRRAHRKNGFEDPHLNAQSNSGSDQKLWGGYGDTITVIIGHYPYQCLSFSPLLIRPLAERSRQTMVASLCITIPLAVLGFLCLSMTQRALKPISQV